MRSEKGSVRFRIQEDCTRIDILAKDVHPFKEYLRKNGKNRRYQTCSLMNHPRCLPCKSDPTERTRQMSGLRASILFKRGRGDYLLKQFLKFPVRWWLRLCFFPDLNFSLAGFPTSPTS